MLLPKASESLDLLTEAALVERFASLRRDLAALYAGYYIAELLTDLTDLHDPHPKLFDAARITLRHLGDPELRTRRVFRFELACLRELGLYARARRIVPTVAVAVDDPREEVVVSAWPQAACSAPPAGRDSRTCDALEHGRSRQSGCWPARARAWRELIAELRGPCGPARSPDRRARSSVMSWDTAPDSALSGSVNR